MSDKKIINADYIRSLTPEQWEQFRQASWQKKRDYYAKPTPEWYLKDRESYALFVERINRQRNNFVKPQSKENLTQKVEILAGDDVDSFADDK